MDTDKHNDIKQDNTYETKTPYGAVISELRREKKITLDEMMRITLTENIEQIEAGSYALSNNQLNVFANILDVSPAGLKKGLNEKPDDIKKEFDKFSDALEKIRESEACILDILQDFGEKPTKFQAKSIETVNKDSDVPVTGKFCIFDLEKNSIVKDPEGKPMIFMSGIDALKKAVELEHGTEIFKKNTVPEINGNIKFKNGDLALSL